MASISKEKGNCYRIHWRFKVRAGPRAGDLIRGSLQLGRCTRAAARSRLREFDEWEERVKTGRHVPDRQWDEVYGLWIRERALRLTAQSLDRVKRVINLYLRWRETRTLPCTTIEQLAERHDLIAWRDHRLDHEAGRKTVANDLSTLSALFDWCVREKYVTENPLLRIERPRFTAHKEGTPLSRPQAGRWLRFIRARSGRRSPAYRSWDDVRRKRQLAVFFLNTGVRNGELCSANVEDLRVDDHEQLLYILGKGLKERWVPLNRAALAALRLHLRARGNPRRGPLFVTAAGQRYNVRQLAGEIVKTGAYCDEDIDVNPHNLRHTFATWLVRAGIDVSVVQKILGHENVNTTLKYYVHTGDNDVARATRNLHGRRTEESQERTATERDYRVIPFPRREVC